MVGNRVWREGYGALFVAFGLALLLGRHAGNTGSTTDLTVLLAMGIFATTVLLTVVAPHVLLAGAIPIFASIPMIKVLAFPRVGPLKDAIIVAAVIGTAVVVLQRRLARERQPVDGLLLLLVGAFLVLYAVNLGAGFGASAYGGQWQQGVRLAAEPMLLLLVGLLAREPAKVLRWTLVSFVATACVVALCGLYQQKIGVSALLGMGYKYDVNVRTINGQLRSFGTLDEPFAYAAFLLLGLALVMFMRINRWVAMAFASLLLLGLAASHVRTALAIVVALSCLWLARKGQATVAILALAATIAALVVFLLSQGAHETHTIQAAPNTYLTINGRTEVWKSVLGNKRQWPLGKGVGVVGTAADRATFGVYQTQPTASRQTTTAVDSGYLATVADVGFLGLVLLLGILGRLGQLCLRFGRSGSAAGWIGGSILLVMMLDAVTRASFSGFPTAFLGMLLIGVTINAASSAATAGAASRT